MTSDRDYLLSLQAVRAQAARVLDAAKANRLQHFHFDNSRMNDVSDYVCKTIEVCHNMLLLENCWPYS
jgi:hypothetical protein